MGENGVMVKHFYELCSDLIGETVVYENESRDYFDIIVEEALANAKECENKYDAILVDEGQDFNDSMYKVVTSLLNSQTNNLTIAMDDNQNIYQRQSSWKAVGVQARGRIHKISYVYRNTKEITSFTSRFLGKDIAARNDSPQPQMELFPDYFDFSGPNPMIQQFPDMESIVQYIPEQIAAEVTKDGGPYSEIAIIYSMKNPDYLSENSLPEMLEKAMEAKGILCSWTAENARTKRNYDITTNSVSISTIHSTKGLDYACVFLLGLDFMAPKLWTEEQIHRLVYVAITRARYQLIIPYVNENDIIVKLKSCL
jgi:superfamily I DNA/RNA helicase